MEQGKISELERENFYCTLINMTSKIEREIKGEK